MCGCSFFTAHKQSCGKVMFLHPCVILFTGGGWLLSMHRRSHDQHCWGVCLQGGLPIGEGSASRGVCLHGGLHSGGLGRPPTGTRKACSMHPSGMLSCFLSHFLHLLPTSVSCHCIILFYFRLLMRETSLR